MKYIIFINKTCFSRYSEAFFINNTEFRRHVKAFGIRFIIVVNSKAGKFDFIPLLISVGSGIGLLGTFACLFLSLKILIIIFIFYCQALPILIADCILLNFTKHKDFYEGIKIHDYEKDDMNFNVRV